MPMLVANGNKVVFVGEDAILITAEGETAPLTSIEDGWDLKVLINNSNEFIRIDVWTQCHVCPPSWVRNPSPEMEQREQYVVRETTTTSMWDCEMVTKPATRRCWKTSRRRCHRRGIRPTAESVSRRWKRRTFCHCLEMRRWMYCDLYRVGTIMLWMMQSCSRT